LNTEKLLRTGVWVLFGATLSIALFPRIWNVDIFWHMAAGDWILQFGQLPSTDVFSAITPERKWFPFQWLYEVVVAVGEDLFGLGGLRLMTGIILAVSTFLLARVLKREGYSPWAVLGLTALTWVLFGDRIRVRPHVINFLFVVLYMGLLRKAPREIDLKKDLMRLLPGIALWANFHAGGVLIFLVMLGTIPGGASVNYLIRKKEGNGDDSKIVLKSWGLWCAAALTAALMPNFVMGTLHVPHLLEDSQSLITEWNSSWSWVLLGLNHWQENGNLIPSMFIVGIVPWLSLGLSILTGFVQFQKPAEERKLMLGGLFLALGVSLIGIRYGRFAWLCIIPIAHCLHCWASPLQRWSKWAPILAILLVGTIFQYQIQVIRNGVAPAIESTLSGHLDERRFPVQGAHFLATSGVKGSAWVLPNWGGYLLWATDRNILVLSDGRGNYDGDTAARLTHVYENRWKPEALNTTLEAYNAYSEIDILVMLHPALPTGETLEGWTRVYPPNRGWIKELGLPPQMETPQKEVIYVKNHRQDAISKALSTWTEVAERIQSQGVGIPAPKGD